eukprot:1314690-Amphidinium_carterae.1
MEDIDDANTATKKHPKRQSVTLGDHCSNTFDHSLFVLIALVQGMCSSIMRMLSMILGQERERSKHKFRRAWKAAIGPVLPGAPWQIVQKKLLTRSASIS